MQYEEQSERCMSTAGPSSRMTEVEQSAPLPELVIVTNQLDNAIERLDKSICVLSDKLSPVLCSEAPKDVGEDRCKRDTELGEAIQSKIDRILRLNNILEDLISRVSL